MVMILVNQIKLSLINNKIFYKMNLKIKKIKIFRIIDFLLYFNFLKIY